LFLLMLGLFGTSLLLAGVPAWSALSEAGLHLNDEVYPVGAIWWAAGPLGIASIAGVYRLMKGHRDWLAAAAAGGWTIIGAWYAATTGQYGMLALTALLALTLISGIWADRRAFR
jgi:hypothetical protein